MRQMQEDEGFRPSVSMYKAHLSKWALYKRNRKQDVIAMLSLKQIRDSAGKSSTIFRSGKQVNMQKLYSYLRRKRLDTRAFEGVENDDMIRMAGHIYARTPSPLSMASNLVSATGSLGFKETILRSISRGYTYWISERAEVTSPMPDIFHSAQIRSLNSIDIVSLLLQHVLKLFQQSRFSKGGSYVRAAFVFIEFHIEGLSKFVRRDEQPLSWIFGLWALLTSGLPSELSQMLLAHFMKLSRAYFPEMHPMSEILRCLFNAHKEGHENFLSFIFSTWADAINALRALLQTSGLDAEVCLSHNLYMGDINGHFQFQDDISEFRRTETIESWHQRVKELSFVLCNNRQLYQPSPSHTHVLTLMWLRRSLVKAVDATRSSHRYVQGYTQQVDSKNFLVKTASVTRLELSVGRRDHSSESEDIRVLSGDVYQVRHLHGPRPGEDSDTFMGKHNLDTHNFEILKNKCRATSGIETDKATWLRWLQILEESLIGPWERRQRLESVVLHQDLRGKGLICTSISTKDGEVGIRKMAKKEENPESSLDTGWMLIDEALFQN
ncbi:Clr5 domain-containing protein [Aspergillus lucknowensis]|uniref:Clr5 domain-containing protein n=1 Tax=Aspergillus lucknowensis TaxID=176173 RepID=A0ABR4LI90_9EURO